MKKYNLEEVYNLEDDYWWFKAKRLLLIKTVKRALKDLNGNARLLDGGCGAGANLKEIQKFLPAVGIEKSYDGLKFCKERNLKDLLNAELEHLPFRHDTFDIVLAMDILEHVDDDAEVLSELSRVCKTGAFLIVHVPAFMFLWCDHDVAVDHKRRYTTDELIERLKRAGFNIRSINYRLCSFFPLGVLRTCLAKFKGALNKNANAQTYRPKVGRFINNILFMAVKIEDYLLNYVHLPFGLSIMCIAQKKKAEF